MRLVPLNDRIVVKRDDETKTTAGGILLPGSGDSKPSAGTVLAVGPGRTLDSGQVVPARVQVGDRVVFGKYASNTCNVGDEEMLILSESEIYGVLRD